MQELRFVAVSEDGRYAVLGVPGRSARFMLPIDERLRAVALGQTSRLAQYEIEVESPLRPKEIQARIRAGETVEEIADAAGIAIERVRWFEGPVLAERAYIAQQAQSASVRRPGDANPGPRLGEIVAERMEAIGTDPEDGEWDAKKRNDGSWLVQLRFTSADLIRVAEWVFDPRRRHVLPADDNAARMSLPGVEPPQLVPAPGEATVTHLTPRLHHGPGPSAAQVPMAHAAPAAPAPRGPLPRTMPPAPAAPVTPVTPAAPVEGRRGEDRPAPGGPAGPPAEVPAAQQASSDSRATDSTPPPEAPAPAPPDTPAASASASSAESTAPAGRQGRKSARSKRSSVPSWDEIMFGNSRQRD
jgi:hypothetical protein